MRWCVDGFELARTNRIEEREARVESVTRVMPWRGSAVLSSVLAASTSILK